jgi:hypothetical protein
MIRVDGKSYQWMGDPAHGLSGAAPVSAVDQKAFVYTSTKSIFTMDVGGKVQMIITFLSPVTPDDYKRQSLPMSYLEVSVVSIDGQEHDVQLYSDISAGKSDVDARLNRTLTDGQSGFLETGVLSQSGRPIY